MGNYHFTIPIHKANSQYCSLYWEHTITDKYKKSYLRGRKKKSAQNNREKRYKKNDM